MQEKTLVIINGKSEAAILFIFPAEVLRPASTNTPIFFLYILCYINIYKNIFHAPYMRSYIEIKISFGFYGAYFIMEATKNNAAKATTICYPKTKVMTRNTLFQLLIYTSPLLIIPIKKEMIARTISTCISPLALYTNTPNNQPITQITAIM